MHYNIKIAYVLAFMMLTISVRTNSKASVNRSVCYYWFSESGDYLRQNTLEDEITFTGYDSVQDNPKTLREKGYDPVNCFPGSPPVPFDPDIPDHILYSHP